MSFNKMDPEFHSNLSAEITNILKLKYGQNSSSIKALARDVNMNPRVVKNWYEGTRVPSLENFIKLCQTIPALKDMFDRKCLIGDDRTPSGSFKNGLEFEIYTINFDSIKSCKQFAKLQNLNQRQIWFYDQINEKRQNVRASDIVLKYAVSIATAYRDIKILIDLKLVKFTGSKKMGYYTIRK